MATSIFPLLTICIGAVILMIHSAVQAETFEAWTWERFDDVYDVIIWDNALLSGTSASVTECITTCTTCTYISFTPTNGLCVGYSSVSLGDPYTEVMDTRFWKRVCRREDLGYQFDPGLQKCVKLYTALGTWNIAVTVCQADTASLLIIDTKDKINSISSGVHASQFAAKTRWWLGGYDYDDSDDDDWKWINGEDIASELWHHSEPNSIMERCVSLYSSTLALNDFPCHNLDPYVCMEV